MNYKIELEQCFSKYGCWASQHQLSPDNLLEMQIPKSYPIPNESETRGHEAWKSVLTNPLGDSVHMKIWEPLEYAKHMYVTSTEIWGLEF